MSKRIILSLFFSIMAPFLYAEEPTETKQSLEILKEKIEHHVLNELASQNNGDMRVTTDKIDSRLNLKACPEGKLEIFNPYQTPLLKTTTMGIRCQSTDTHWTLYVPIRIYMQKQVFVANHPLAKGSLLTEQDINTAKIDISQLKQGYFTKKEEVIGQYSKQNISEGAVLNSTNLQMALMVHKGEQVAIQALSDMINVSMSGIALNDGRIGDIIQVRNNSSKRLIEAQVSARKQVRVAL